MDRSAFKASGAALITLCLSGCASLSTDAKDWAFAGKSAAEPAKLAYGQPETDDVDLMLWCDPARGRVLIVPVGAEGEQFHRLALESAGQRISLDLRQDGSLGSVGSLPINAPLLAAFRSTGRLAVSPSHGRRKRLDTKSSSSQSQVRAFFDNCR